MPSVICKQLPGVDDPAQPFVQEILARSAQASAKLIWADWLDENYATRDLVAGVRYLAEVGSWPVRGTENCWYYGLNFCFNLHALLANIGKHCESYRPLDREKGWKRLWKAHAKGRLSWDELMTQVGEIARRAESRKIHKGESIA